MKISQIVLISALASAPDLQAAAVFDSYLLVQGGTTILPNPFATIEGLSGSEARLSVTSIDVLPLSLSLVWMTPAATYEPIYILSSSPVVSAFPPDPMAEGNGVTFYSWSETFAFSLNTENLAIAGDLYFQIGFQNGSFRRDRFFSNSIPEPTAPALILIGAFIALTRRNRPNPKEPF